MKSVAASLSVAFALTVGAAAAGAAIATAPVSGPAHAVAPGVQIAQAADVAGLVIEGAPVFAEYCAGCHGAAGEGGVGPRLAGNAGMSSERYIIKQVLFGSDYMPQFASRFDNHQMAVVAAYVMNSWGNDHPVLVTDEFAAEIRAEGP